MCKKRKKNFKAFENFFEYRTLLQDSSHKHEVHCSRERSQAAWKVIEEVKTFYILNHTLWSIWISFPRVEELAALYFYHILPSSCQLMHILSRKILILVALFSPKRESLLINVCLGTMNTGDPICIENHGYNNFKNLAKEM